MRLQLGLIPRLQWVRFLCQIPEDYIFVSMQPLLYHDGGLKKETLTNSQVSHHSICKLRMSSIKRIISSLSYVSPCRWSSGVGHRPTKATVIP